MNDILKTAELFNVRKDGKHMYNEWSLNEFYCGITDPALEYENVFTFERIM